MSSQTFTKAFEDHFGITGYHRPKTSGGQKDVHFPTVNGKDIVMKLLRSRRDARFDREMVIYEKYKDSPGIPKIISIEDYNGEVIIFEEFIAGETLSDIIPSYHNDCQAIKFLAKDLFDILNPIWQEGYVHRDIKPENIIIQSNRKPVLIDFGIARDLGSQTLTAAGFQPMSWMFASPEQYVGNKDMISYRTDFFSIGALLYYLFHQKLPFGNSESEIGARFKTADESFVCNSGFDLTSFCTEAMKFKVSERPRSIEDLYKLI